VTPERDTDIGLTHPRHASPVTGTQELESLDLPAGVLERIDARVERTEFEDATAYVTHVLEEVLFEVEEATDAGAEAVDEQQVEERLKSLGYLNE
jgi:hypothetical protein